MAEALVPQPNGDMVAQVVEAQTTEGGDVYVSGLGDESAEDAHASSAGDSSGASIDPCQDNVYGLIGFQETDVHNWYFKPNTTPTDDGITEAGALAAIQQAGRNIAQVNNDCGLVDNVAFNFNYAGTASTSTNMNATNPVCSANGNGESVVAFGDLPGTYVGYMCQWHSGTLSPSGPPFAELNEADVRLNKAEWNWWTSTDDCSGLNRYDVEGVMTHERGHSVGLAHPINSEPDHGALTMSSILKNAEACETGERTLGLGDVLGLERLY
jgi:hypothetical protein